jgi:hypothetical protein
MYWNAYAWIFGANCIAQPFYVITTANFLHNPMVLHIVDFKGVVVCLHNQILCFSEIFDDLYLNFVFIHSLKVGEQL